MSGRRAHQRHLSTGVRPILHATPTDRLCSLGRVSRTCYLKKSLGFASREILAAPVGSLRQRKSFSFGEFAYGVTCAAFALLDRGLALRKCGQEVDNEEFDALLAFGSFPAALCLGVESCSSCCLSD